MTQTTDIQASEELTLPGNHAAASADGLVVDNTNDSAGQEEGFEIVLKDDEKPKQDPATNAEFARRRIERKRQRELEQQMEAVKRGELPEHLRVNPELPKQPDPNDYLSEDALAKYDYDHSRALAAFQQANSEWQIKAMDARSQAVAEQGRKTQEFTQQSAQYVEAARKHYDAAEKLNILTIRRKRMHSCNWCRQQSVPTSCASSRRNPLLSCITLVLILRKHASCWRWTGNPR